MPSFLECVANPRKLYTTAQTTTPGRRGAVTHAQSIKRRVQTRAPRWGQTAPHSASECRRSAISPPCQQPTVGPRVPSRAIDVGCCAHRRQTQQPGNRHGCCQTGCPRDAQACARAGANSRLSGDMKERAMATCSSATLITNTHGHRAGPNRPSGCESKAIPSTERIVRGRKHAWQRVSKRHPRVHVGATPRRRLSLAHSGRHPACAGRHRRRRRRRRGRALHRSRRSKPAATEVTTFPRTCTRTAARTPCTSG